LPIADCRLTIEESVAQLLPISIGNPQSKNGNLPEGLGLPSRRGGSRIA
jgi:hypothetical protein